MKNPAGKKDREEQALKDGSCQTPGLTSLPVAFQVSKTPEYKRNSDLEDLSVFVLFLSVLTTALS